MRSGKRVRVGILVVLVWNVPDAFRPVFAADQEINAFRGLVPGAATRAEAAKILGPSLHGDRGNGIWVPATGQLRLSDRLYFGGDKLRAVTAASDDPRYPDRDRIVKLFGRPEMRYRFRTQEYLDYSRHGLRFICGADGKTTGIAYIPTGRRRVPEGYTDDLDLRREPGDAPAARPPADFRVGAAQRSIAPASFTDIAWDSARNTYHLAEDVFARVAIFQHGDSKIVFIGLDVFGLGAWDTRKLRRSLAAKGFDNVLVCMSHTHANVDTIGFYGYYPKNYAAHVIQETERAVLDAAQAMTPIDSLAIGTVEMPLAGARVVDLVLNWRDAGIVDPLLTVVQAIGKDGRPILNLIHLACHPEAIDLKRRRGISPDFVGALCSETHRRLGGQSVFINGALGGMVSVDNHDRTQEEAVRIGRGLADYAVQAAKNAKPSSSYTLAIRRRPVEYPVTSPAIAEFSKKAAGSVDMHQGRLLTEMNAVWIGDAQFITVPGELLPELGMEISSRMAGRFRMVTGLTNDEVGYLVPSYDFRAGGYEERTGPGAAGGEITRSVGLELAAWRPSAAGH